MMVGVTLGILGLLLLAGTVHSQSLGFPETDYTVVESAPGDRRLSIEKSGVNVGNITVLVRFLTFDQFPTQPTINVSGVDPAEVGRLDLPDDFNSQEMEFIFPPSNQVDEIEFNAPIFDDDIHEADEGFFALIGVTFTDDVDIANFQDRVQSDALIRIVDDDIILFGFEQETYMLNEGSGVTNVRFGKVMNQATELNLTVMIDYDSLPREVIDDFILNGGVSLPMAFLFQPSDMFLSFALTIIDDNILETDETFSLSLFKNTSVENVDIAPRRTLITIIDNEEIEFGFSDTSISVMENDGSAVVGLEVFEPVDPNQISDAIAVHVFFVNVIAISGTATSADDFSIAPRSAPFDIAFSYDSTLQVWALSSATFTATITDDTVPEPDEEFTLVLVPADPATTLNRNIVNLAPNVSQITIQDNDATPSIIQIERELYQTSEDMGFVEICVAIVEPTDLSLLRSSYLANLSLSLEAVTAQVVDDYEDLMQPFSLSPTNDRRCFNVTIVDDDVLEVSEYFRATLVAVGDLPQNTSLNITQARVDIGDNEVGVVGFVTEDVNVTEGVDNFAIVTVSFLSPAVISVDTFTTLTIFTADGTALVDSDYSQTVLNVTLRGNGDEMMQIMIPIVDDNRVEETEYFTLNFNVIADSGNIRLYQPNVTTIQIFDVDVPTPATIELDRSIYMASEGVDTVQICAVISEPADLSTLDPTFQANLILSTTQDSALDGDDYLGIMPSFSLSPNNGRVCFNVSITDDSIFELTEYFNVSLALDVNATLPDGAAFGTTRARVQIADNEVAVIGLRNETYMVNEPDGSITVYVEFLSPDQISEDVVIDLAIVTQNDTAFDGSDYNGAEVPFTLQGGINETFSIVLRIINDDVVERPENEDFQITVTSSSPLIGDGRLTIVPSQGVVTIVDDDVYVESLVGFEQPQYNVTEGDGSVEICTAILEPANASLLHDTYVANFSLSLTSGSATVDEDFGSLFVFFSLTPTNPRQCFNINITDDTVLEILEDFVGSLRIQDPPPPAITFGLLSTTVLIFDNDDAIIGFDNTDIFLVESEGPAVITISFQDPNQISPDVEVTLNLITVDDTAIAGSDYNTTEVTFTLSGGGNEMFEVNIDIIDDDIQEVPNIENFTAVISSVSSNVPFILDPDTALVTIMDDDEPVEIVIGLEQTRYDVTEDGGLIQICAAILVPADINTLDQSFELDLLFSVQSLNATVVEDFQNVSMTIQFSTTNTRICVNISIVDDNVLENTEDFLVRLDPSTVLPAGVRIVPSMAVVYIFDNEIRSVIGIEEPEYMRSEGDRFVEICVSIQEPADPTTLDSSYSATLNLSTVSASAIAPDDYASFTELFTLTPFESRMCFNVSIEDDDTLEVTEYFSANLEPFGMLPPAAELDITSTNVQITDNERGRIGILNVSITVTEFDGFATVYIGFVEPSEISEDIRANITFFTADGTAFAGQDYNATQETFTLQGGIRELYSVNIPISDDGIDEASETFMTRIAAADPLPPMIDLDPVEGVVTILGTIISSPSPSPPTDPPDNPGSGEVTMGGDPHYSIMLPSGQLLCFSVHGEKDFPFNLISNNLLQMNAFFIEDALRDEITWIGSLGVVVHNVHYKKSNSTKIRFEAKDQLIHINNGVTLHARKVEKLTLAHGKLTITEALRRRGDKKPVVEVDLVDVGLAFSMRFVKKRHLDMSWKRVHLQPADSHGLIGQFMRKGVEIDETRKLLYLPSLPPVPVMRSSVWHFMERETPDPEQKLCWQAMNPGYQGKMLIEGSYLDYLVDDVLSPNFKFKPKSKEY